MTAVQDGQRLPRRSPLSSHVAGQWLGNGSYLLSANAQYGAILQDDANLALTMTDPGPPATPDLHRPFWGITAQPGNYVPAGIRQLAHPVRAPFIVCMQDNGQLVISWGSYHPGSAAYPLWATPAGASGDYIAVLRDDGTLAVCAGTDPGTQASPLWESARDTDPNAIIMSITGGNHQSMTFSQAWTWQQFPQPLTVKLARQNGAPVIGQPVSFAIGGVTGEGGQAYGDQRLNSAGDTTGWCNTTTDGDGKASAIAWGSTWVQEDVGLLFSVSCDNQQTFQWFTLDMFLNSG